MPLFGSHLSVAGSFTNAVTAAVGLGCQTVQIFTKAPSQWAGREITREEAAEFRKAVRTANLKSTLAHDSYLINLASPDEDMYRKSIEAFIDEMQRAELLGLRYLVTHPGAHMDSGEEAGLARVIAALDECHERTPAFKLQVLIETTAGQGTCLGWRFEHLGKILDSVKEPKRLGVCVDSCHIFAAGYDISTIGGYRRAMKEFNRVVGCRWIKAWHLNDSAKPLGSRIDRHAHLGQGAIGRESFGHIVRDKRFVNAPMILETPKEDDMDVVNLALLRELAAAA